MIAILLVMFLSGAALWYYSKPSDGSVLYWVGGALIMLPVYIGLEGLGEIVFSRKIGEMMSRPMRIIYGVFVVISIIAIYSVLSTFFLNIVS